MSEIFADLLGTPLVPKQHQSKLAPAANKFHVGNGDDGKHYWLTPPELYADLDAEFAFDFDPCPFPLPEGFDGLTCDWGQSSYVNPPFGSIIHQGKKKGPTAWVRKAIEEHRKGKTVVPAASKKRRSAPKAFFIGSAPKDCSTIATARSVRFWRIVAYQGKAHEPVAVDREPSSAAPGSEGPHRGRGHPPAARRLGAAPDEGREVPAEG